MEYYEKNLQLLLRRFPVLTRRLRREPEDPNIRVIIDTKRDPNAAVIRDGRAYMVHPPEDPIGQAKRIIQETKAGREGWNCCVIGAGMGYLPLLLTQRQPNPPRLLLILEPSVHMFRLACQYVNLEPLLTASSTHLLIGPTSSREIEQIFYARRWDLIANNLVTLVHPSMAELFPDWLRRTRDLLDTIWRKLQGNMTTVLLDGPKLTENLVSNLPTFIDSPGIQPGSGLLKNIPAVIIAAGPSLRRNIADLRTIHRKALVIVCDTAFERVTAAGAHPHFVVTLDPSDLNERHFPRSDYTDTKTWLIYDIGCHPTIPGRFPGRAVTYSARRFPFFEWLDRICGGKGLIRPGMMVSQTALNIAAFWGCRPIILVGQDLALDPQTGDTHFDGAAIKRTVQFITDDRQHVLYPSIDGKESRKEPIYWVDGVNGEPVPTVQYLLDYLRGLEENISVLDVPVINSTEGGARIAGTIKVSLTEALNRYGADRLDLRGFRSRLVQESTPGDLSTIQRHFQRTTDLLDKAVTVLLRRLAELESQPEGWAEETSAIIERTVDQVFRDGVLSFFVEQVSGQAVVDAHRHQLASVPLTKCVDEVRIRCGRLSDALQHTATVLRRIFS